MTNKAFGFASVAHHDEEGEMMTRVTPQRTFQMNSLNHDAQQTRKARVLSADTKEISSKSLRHLIDFILTVYIALICIKAEAKPLSSALDSWNAALAKIESESNKRGTPYRPRSEHLLADGRAKYLNRLILETSPYLRQHAHNPVEWYPWGDEAFETALKEDKPILLSIGYSTCHWCHVMERESFEDEEIAAYLNEHFIAIKVDREERPDIDDVYMKAVQALTGRGGWPMTTLLTPQAQPFFGATYLPPRDGARGRQKGFLSILKEYHQRYKEDRDTLLKAAKRLNRYMLQSTRLRPSDSPPNPEVIVKAVKQLADRFDPQWGGFGKAPKFPTPPQLTLLLRYYQRVGDPQALHLLAYTLKKMAWGGLYDHVGGGFHRYSTDAHWRVPHFEKMLYDNAQLIPLYLKCALYVDDETSALFREVASETLEYLNREMRSPLGLYYSATDADSRPEMGGLLEEGLFFTWPKTELAQLLSPKEFELLRQVYHITERGDLDGRNILYRSESLSATAKRLGISFPAFKTTLKDLKLKLWAQRSKRQPPLRDEKSITSWNGLMISALVSGARLIDPTYLLQAESLADALLVHLRDVRHGSEHYPLARSYMSGEARHHAVLDDYAFLIQGLLDLFELSGRARWLQAAISLQNELDQNYWSKRWGGYFMTSDLSKALLTKDRPSDDGAEPSGNAVSANNLMRLYTLTDQEVYRRRAEQLLRAFSAPLKTGYGVGTMLSTLLNYHGQARQLAIVLPHSSPKTSPLLDAIKRGDWANTAIVIVRLDQAEEKSTLESLIPWIKDKPAQLFEGELSPTAYLCYEGMCEPPKIKASTLLKSLEQRVPLFSDHSPTPLPLPASDLPH